MRDKQVIIASPEPKCIAEDLRAAAESFGTGYSGRYNGCTLQATGRNSEVRVMTRILIVGGVAGGATAAARLRRLDENAEIVIFERGGAVSFANCGLPYHISGVIPERKNLRAE